MRSARPLLAKVAVPLAATLLLTPRVFAQDAVDNYHAAVFARAFSLTQAPHRRHHHHHHKKHPHLHLLSHRHHKSKAKSGALQELEAEKRAEETEREKQLQAQHKEELRKHEEVVRQELVAAKQAEEAEREVKLQQADQNTKEAKTEAVVQHQAKDAVEAALEEADQEMDQSQTQKAQVHDEVQAKSAAQAQAQAQAQVQAQTETAKVQSRVNATLQDSSSGHGGDGEDLEEPQPDAEAASGPAPATTGNVTTKYVDAKRIAKKRYHVHDEGELPLLPPKDSEPRDFKAEHNPAVASRYHPLVDRQLDNMNGAIKELKQKRKEADAERREMSAQRAAAMAHMNDAVGIQREEIRAEDIEKAQVKVVKKIKDESGKLQASHDSLFAKLDIIMEPKIAHSKKREIKEAEILNKTAEVVKGWDAKMRGAKDEAVSTLQARRAALRQLRESSEALEKARKAHDAAEKAYRLAKMKANGKVEQFRFSDTRYRASLEKRAEKEAAYKEALQSTKKLQGILEMETKRIDQALAIGKVRLQRKLSRAEKIEAEAGHAAKLLRERYGEWQSQQRDRAGAAAEKLHQYQASLKAYADTRKEVFETAQAKAGEHAESISDWAWDDWAWSKGHDSEGAMATPVSLDKPLEAQNPDPSAGDDPTLVVKDVEGAGGPAAATF